MRVMKNKIKTSDKSDRYIFIGYADNLQGSNG